MVNEDNSNSIVLAGPEQQEQIVCNYIVRFHFRFHNLEYLFNFPKCVKVTLNL